MQIFRDPAQLPNDYRSTVVSVGNYDGVHLGHRFLLARVVERARALGARSVAVTFEPHPTDLLRPGTGPRLITPTLAERLDLLSTTGIDAVVVLSFTAEFSRQSAESFARDVLLQRLHAVEIHEGDNFRFGYRAEAGVDELRALGARLGFAVHIYPALQVRGMNVSVKPHPQARLRGRCPPCPLAARPPLLHPQHACAWPRHRQPPHCPHHQSG